MDEETQSLHPPEPSESRSLGGERNPAKTKLQVSAGYTFDSNPMAALISFIAGQPEIRRFGRKQIIEGTGMTDRQVEGFVSMGAAMGLIVPRTQVLTPWGKLVAQHDLFLDSLPTLEYCHFLAASNRENLVWFKVFNEIPVSGKSIDQSGWSEWFRQRLTGQYSARSLIKHIANEVHFIVDAYTVKAFKRLELIVKSPEQNLTLGRRTNVSPHTLAASIYSFADHYPSKVVPFDDLHTVAGSPGLVFGLDAPLMRQMVENLHQKTWLRFEVRHGLDQIRLVQGLNALEFLKSAYEDREPEPQTQSLSPASRQACLL
jgi:hypothetical protein